MAFHDPDLEGHGSRVASEDRENGASALRPRVDLRQIVKARGCAFIDLKVLRAFGLDHIAEGGEGLAGEGFWPQSRGHVTGFPKRRRRLIPPSGKMLRRT